MRTLRYPHLSQNLVAAWCPSMENERGAELWGWRRGYRMQLVNMDPATDFVPVEGKMTVETDGSNDYMSVVAATGRPKALEVTELTLCCWIQFQNNTGTKYIFDHDDSAGIGGYYLYRNVNALTAGSRNGVNHYSITGTIPGMPDYTRIYHVASTLSATETVLYVDGKPIATGSGRTIANSNRAVMWGSNTGTTENIAARFDDMQIHRVALPAADIKILALRRGIIHETETRRSYKRGAGPTFKAAWLNQRSQIIGGGVR